MSSVKSMKREYSQPKSIKNIYISRRQAVFSWKAKERTEEQKTEKRAKKSEKRAKKSKRA